MAEAKTPESIRKAVKKYSEKFDKVTLLLPKGTKELVARLASVGEESFNSYIKNLVIQDLNKRRREIMSVVTDRIKEDMKSCKTPEDWSKAYSRLYEDFVNTVDGERNFEQYVSDVLGVEAMRKFAANIREPLYTQQMVKYLEALGDFSFQQEDFKDLDDNEKNLMCKSIYSYLSHMFLAITSRCNKVEENITRLLGAEAFERLVSQGSYEKDKAWQYIAAAIPDGNMRTKIFLDYMTDKGIFAEMGAKQDKPLTLGTDWTEVQDKLPKSEGIYMVLLQDMSQMLAYFYAEKKHWIKGRMEWTPLVIAWKEHSLEEDKPGETEGEAGQTETA